MTFPSKNGSSYPDSIASLILLPLVWIFISVRLYVRGFLVRQPGWDDAACLIAGIVYTFECTAVMVLNPISVSIGEPPSPKRLILSFQWYVAGAALYGASCFFLKLSLGLGLLRMLNLRHFTAQWERITCYACIALSSAANLEFFFFILFVCAGHGVMPGNLGAAIAEGRCNVGSTGFKVSTYTQTTVNLLVDMTFVLLPLPSILATSMNWRLRLSLLLILLLGALGSVASIIRLAYIHTFWTTHSRISSIGSVVSLIEIGIFIICSCLATFHPLVAKFYRKAENYTEASFHIPGENETIVEHLDLPKRQSSETTVV